MKKYGDKSCRGTETEMRKISEHEEWRCARLESATSCSKDQRKTIHGCYRISVDGPPIPAKVMVAENLEKYYQIENYLTLQREVHGTGPELIR